jgi:pheromone shutdown protein TraB
MTGAQFGKRWRQAVPVLRRLMMWCLAREQELQHEASGGMDTVMVDERGALLVDMLVSIHDERSSEPINVAVVYGASHIPGVAAALLTRLGYRARSAEWLTVYDF